MEFIVYVTVFEKIGKVIFSSAGGNTWRFHNTAHVDYYTYIVSTRLVGKLRCTCCVRNATVLGRQFCNVMLLCCVIFHEKSHTKCI